VLSVGGPVSAAGKPAERRPELSKEIEMTINILTICGSLRQASLNRALLNALPGLAPAGMAFSEAPPYRGFPLYDNDLQDSAGIPADVAALGDAIRAADATVIACPEYNWSIPGPLKNAIDWLSRLPEQPFQNRPVLLQSVTPGPLGGSRMQYHLRMALTSLEAFVFGKPEIFVGMGKTKFDEKTMTLTDEPTRKIIAVQLAAFETFVARVKA
jgi:chromate reductase, NAD(P)H dehydrogenase (quinone)